MTTRCRRSSIRRSNRGRAGAARRGRAQSFLYERQGADRRHCRACAAFRRQPRHGEHRIQSAHQLTQVNPIWVRFSLAMSTSNASAARRTHAGHAAQRHRRVAGSVAARNGRLNFTAPQWIRSWARCQLAPSLRIRAQWLPGQFAKVQIFAGEQEAFLVPQAAVMQTNSAHV